MSKYTFQRPEMEMPLQNSHYIPSRETLGRYSEYSLHSSYKIRAGDAACKLISFYYTFFFFFIVNLKLLTVSIIAD
jgi:hypothetical protein